MSHSKRRILIISEQNTKLTNSVVEEPEGSSPHSQQPATGPCLETVESEQNTVDLISSHIPVSLQCVLHIPPIPSILIY
jgi:hypothetical protein